MQIAAQLRELIGNLWWSWHPYAVALFRDIDADLWGEVNHNPVLFLNQIAPERLEKRAAELALEARISFAFHRLHDYLEYRKEWGHIHCGVLHWRPVAYFSAEFGLHESIPIYSGGLGVLAGDHLKTASDLGVPIVGVGLFYAQGYFNQRLDASGWQTETYPEANVEQLPFEQVTAPSGEPLRMQVMSRQGAINLGVWRMSVGRNSLYLLDSNVDGNSSDDRQLTGRLYGGDHGVRIWFRR